MLCPHGYTAGWDCPYCECPVCGRPEAECPPGAHDTARPEEGGE